LPQKDGAFASEELTRRQHQPSQASWDLAPQVRIYREREVLRRHEARLEEEQVMPKVGKKKFPYTAKGKAAAKAFAKKVGKKMSKGKGY
jgi:hypothetical protein